MSTHFTPSEQDTQNWSMRAAVVLPANPDERLAELSEILAAGLMRVAARKSSELCADSGESSLHFSLPQSGHPTPVNRRMSDG